MASEYRHQDITAAPAGTKVRTVHAGKHLLRFAFPKGARKKGAGRLVSILHPKRELNPEGCFQFFLTAEGEGEFSIPIAALDNNFGDEFSVALEDSIPGDATQNPTSWLALWRQFTQKVKASLSDHPAAEGNPFNNAVDEVRALLRTGQGKDLKARTVFRPVGSNQALVEINGAIFTIDNPRRLVDAGITLKRSKAATQWPGLKTEGGVIELFKQYPKLGAADFAIGPQREAGGKNAMNEPSAAGTYKGVPMIFQGISYQAPSLKLFGYSSDLALKRAIDKKLKKAGKNARVTYDVIVGNIGTVRSGVTRKEADKAFREYVSQSKSGVGRAGMEEVIMLDSNSEIVKEYQPPVREENPRNQHRLQIYAGLGLDDGKPWIQKLENGKVSNITITEALKLAPKADDLYIGHTVVNLKTFLKQAKKMAPKTGNPGEYIEEWKAPDGSFWRIVLDAQSMKDSPKVKYWRVIAKPGVGAPAKYKELSTNRWADDFRTPKSATRDVKAQIKKLYGMEGASRNARPVTALNVIRTGNSQQEIYESASRDAGVRAKQLRELGFKVTTASLGPQVTNLGVMKLTALNIHYPGDREIPPPDKIERNPINPAGVDVRIVRSNINKNSFKVWVSGPSGIGWLRQGFAWKTKAGAIAAAKKAFPSAEISVANPGKGKRNLDEIGAAAELAGEFQGRPAKQVREISLPSKQRDDFAHLGWLEQLVFHPPFDRESVNLKKLSADYDRAYQDTGKTDKAWREVAAEHNVTLLVFDMSGDEIELAASADGKQLFLLGGKQAGFEKLLGDFQTDTNHDLVDLGDLVSATYTAKKTQTGDTEERGYYHIFGEEGGSAPRAAFDMLNKRILLSGGTYHLKEAERGIIN